MPPRLGSDASSELLANDQLHLNSPPSVVEEGRTDFAQTFIYDMPACHPAYQSATLPACLPVYHPTYLSWHDIQWTRTRSETIKNELIVT